MKFQSLAVLFALAMASASAAECTDQQLNATNLTADPDFVNGCPSLFQDGEDTLDFTDLGSLNATTIATLEPCKEQACLAQLTRVVDKTPDCEVVGVNIKAAYSATLKLCQKLGQGAVTTQQVGEIFKDVIANVSNALTDGFNGAFGSDSSDGSAFSSVPVGTAKPANATEAPSSSATETPKPAASSPVPTTTPKPTSTASATTVASAVVISSMIAAML